MRRVLANGAGARLTLDSLRDEYDRAKMRVELHDLRGLVRDLRGDIAERAAAMEAMAHRLGSETRILWRDPDGWEWSPADLTTCDLGEWWEGR